MNIKKIGALIAILTLSISCEFIKTNNNPTKEIATQVIEEPATTQVSKGDAIIAKAIKAHGGTLYDQADYSFTFRKNRYHFKNDGKEFTYDVQLKGANGENIKDVIENGTFTRFVNEKAVTLSDKDISKYSQALNSVVYFATLPHKLMDKAVHKSYKGTTSIKGLKYDVVEVFFDEEGGGVDHDDTYHYWVNTQTSTIDYLAYNYTVNGGGARFRSFYNRRNVGGIIFQDYINWGAHKDTPLAELAVLFEKGTLKQLSKIETENVQTTN